MNILTATFEVSPLAKTGGLADVTQALALEWQKSGHHSKLILPKHKSIDTDKYGFQKMDLKLSIPMGFTIEYAALWKGYLPNSKAEVYLIEHDDYFSRDGIYGNPESYFDNDRRFIFYCRAVMEAAIALDFKVDILHAHDYHASFTLAFLKSYYTENPYFNNCKGVLTIHNLAYQGKFDPWRAMDFSGFGMKEFYPGSWFEMYGMVNCMKVGIMFADKITTVSPNYAKEIRMPYYSEGLQDVLNHRGADVLGVLNGVFYDLWDPKTDKKIFENYGPDSLEKKRANKHQFLKSLGLTESDDLDKPLVGMVSRLTEHKGIDIIEDKLDDFISQNRIRFVLLGSGDKEYVDFFNKLNWKYKNNALITIGYDEEHAHRIISSSDYLILPSRFEPCGLTQMYAMKYGTVPIVRSTGGLADTVSEYIPESGEGTGFSFFNYDKEDFAYALHRALSIYQVDKHWDQIRLNDMKQDFSARRQAEEYIKVFEWTRES